MTAPAFRFPFGSPLKKVYQKDRTPKKDFVLGVYASAVHAVWKDAKGKILVRALAHPRQIAKLGTSSRKWHDLHQDWMKKMARRRKK